MGEPEGTTDRQEVAETFRRLEGPLLRFAARITRERESARDAVQETFLRLCSVDPARINGHTCEWLLGVCHNLALDVRKKERRMICISQTSDETKTRLQDPPGHQPPPSAAAETRELAALLNSALDALPPNQQLVVHLKFDDDLTHRQIAALTNRTVRSVHYLLRTGLSTLRQQHALDPHDGTDRQGTRS